MKRVPDASFFIIVAAFLIVALTLVQSASYSVLFGVKPNFILAILIVLAALTESGLTFGFFVLLSGALLSFHEGIGSEIVFLWGVSVAAFLARRILPWHAFLNALAMIVIGTVLFYAALDIGFLYREPSILIQELVYNSVIGGILYGLLQRIKPNSLVV
jgi:hypothetical protein